MNTYNIPLVVLNELAVKVLSTLDVHSKSNALLQDASACY